jgi:hypothetical protein
MKFMIARCRARSGFGAAPGAVITLEIIRGSVGISQVADSHHRAGNLIEQFGGGFSAREAVAIGDIAGPD